jgi:ribose/xylose/arabinose/galactoside ABC-type transport system permease subunit
LVGVLVVGLVQSGNPGTGTGFELQVIGAVVVGGVNLFGGAGSVLGAVIGAAILSIIGDGLILMGVSVFAEQLVEGLIIIVAVFIDIRLRRLTVRR